MTKWISVKDRLPKGEKLVLVFWPDEEESYCICSSKFVRESYKKEAVQHITHWMPLPRAPITRYKGIYGLSFRKDFPTVSIPLYPPKMKKVKDE